jgi:hypothetical protein
VNEHIDSPAKKQRKNLTDIGVGIILAICLYFLILTTYSQFTRWQAQAPATNWVEVSSLAVPNFQPGVDPVIEYVREIKQSVSSSWTAELRHYPNDSGDYELICERSGFTELEPGRAPPPGGWTLGSFAGIDCVKNITTQGRYRLQIIWELRPRGYDRTITYPISSNTFFVGEEPTNG